MKLEMLKAYEELKNKAILYSLRFRLARDKQQPTAPLFITQLAKKSKSKIIPFVDRHEEQVFIDAKKQLGDEWIWANRYIDYSINSHGYRMKEFDQIDWDNYMVSFGCSFAFGLGLPEEETYSHKISKHTGLDLVNAGVMGSGNDLIISNLSNLLTHAPRPPKLVVIGWTDVTRKFFWGENDQILPYFSNIELTPNHTWADAYKNYLGNEHAWMREFQDIKQQVDLLCRLADIPCWQFTQYYGLEFDNSIEKILYFKQLKSELDIATLNTHFARDVDINGLRLAHPGLDQQENILTQFQLSAKYS